MNIEKGKLACICTGILYFVVGVLIMLKPFSKERYDLYIVVAMLFLGGIGSLFIFVIKSRARFRPGWVLPQGITGIIMSVIMFLIIITDIYDINVAANQILAYLAIITAVLHLSASIQIKCLGFPRWWIMFFFGGADLVYASFAYFYMIDAKEISFTAFGVFFILLAIQFLAETVSYKIPIHKENIEYK